MQIAPFIGRTRELQALTKLWKKSAASLVVVLGRRRVGKSRLIEEFGKKYTFYQFSAIPPTDKTTKQSQLNEFSRQLTTLTRLPEVQVDDWSKLFILLADKIKHGKVVVLFDEISWMGSRDPDFLGKLKNAWDIYFKQNPQLILILCGSASAWIEKNILSSTGFLGRISFRLTVEELPLDECNKFWSTYTNKISAYEKLKVLAVTGGIPRYLEEIKPSLSAEENLKDLCFTKGGPLVNEFNEIFSDLFSKKSPTYKKIVVALALHPMEIAGLCAQLKIEPTGFISECLDDLIESGFITRDYTWHIKSGELSKLSHFRLSDNYLRFYLKYIDRYLHKINNNNFLYKSITAMPGYETIMGFQFENLILKNRSYVKEKLSINFDEVISDNPFFQRQTLRNNACQIDYMIQTKFNCLYVCEIKFSKNPITLKVVQDVQQKIDNLVYPRGFSIRPVLIHVGGVQDEVVESGFFAEIIDFSELLG